MKTTKPGGSHEAMGHGQAHVLEHSPRRSAPAQPQRAEAEELRSARHPLQRLQGRRPGGRDGGDGSHRHQVGSLDGQHRHLDRSGRLRSDHARPGEEPHRRARRGAAGTREERELPGVDKRRRGPVRPLFFSMRHPCPGHLQDFCNPGLYHIHAYLRM